MPIKFTIETVGCQMNVLDSELAAAMLISRGYEQLPSRRGAQVILFNTCSIREHAEEKVYSALGRLKHWKEEFPQAVIGVMGCMAQKDQKIIFRRAPQVDLVIGPGQLDRLPELIESVIEERQSQMAVSLGRLDNAAADVQESFRQYDPERLVETRPTPWQAMVRIVFGCNKFCSYCIVPSVRGPEQSRPATQIVEEVRRLVDQGCREVTLIGQTVNSYKYRQGEQTILLPQLLEQLDAIAGIERIRFVSNYPTGMSDELLRAVRDLPRVMPFIHVPAQHGADSVLTRMKRNYSVAEYRDLADRIYATIPGASITSDFIVGFCGETDEEFEQTVELVRYARFKNSFIFKYSERTGTKSAMLYPDDIPEEIKRQRNNELLAVQTTISEEENRRFLGKTVKILVEGPSKWQSKSSSNITASLSQLPLVLPSEQIQLTGRTPCDRIAVFNGPTSLAGEIVSIRITETGPFTLIGESYTPGF